MALKNIRIQDLKEGQTYITGDMTGGGKVIVIKELYKDPEEDFPVVLVQMPDGSQRKMGGIDPYIPEFYTEDSFISMAEARRFFYQRGKLI